jgi:hypothetical protein
LSWALAQHPDLWTGPETDFLYYLASPQGVGWTWERAAAREDGWLRYFRVDLAEYHAWVGHGVDRMMLSRSGGKRWIDSSTTNVLAVRQLAQMFPNAQFLHIIRDGRAVVNSAIHFGFDPNLADFKTACKYWVTCVRNGLRAKAEMPDRVLELRQERLLSDPEGLFEETQRFLGVEPSDLPSRFVRRGRINSSYGNTSRSDVAKTKPHESMPEAPWREWGLYQRYAFRRYAGPLMAELGYDTSLD